MQSHIPVRKKPRKLTVVKPSKYESAEAIHANKDYWKKVLDATNNATESEITESRKLYEILPTDLYIKVCNTLNLPRSPTLNLKSENKDDEDGKERKTIKTSKLSNRQTLKIERDLESDTDVETSPRDKEEMVNIHWELLKKPEREQITWPTRYLEPEREDEKTLIKKADDLTNRIAEEFCQYMKELGGDQKSNLFTPKAIKELFQIEFDTHIARGVSIIPKELPSLPNKVAQSAGYPETSKNSCLNREVTKDIAAEARSDRLVSFGRALPNHEQFRAPKNNAQYLWRSSRYVPKDLVTLKTVWEGITNLRSVREYCRWMIDHPEYRRAPYLNSLGLFDAAVLDARISYEYGSQQRPSSTSVIENKANSENGENIYKSATTINELNEW